MRIMQSIQWAAVAALVVAVPAGGQIRSQGARYTRPDVRFMQDMIGHHTQALVMAGLIPARSTRPEIAALGERITVSQRDEIAAMRRWLLARHEDAPQANVDQGYGTASMNGMTMPGMISEAEMMQLEDAKGNEFDRLFLTLMIRHQEGAITMVKDLFTNQGAGQEPEISRLVSKVDSDQRAEVARMRALLNAR